MLIKRRTDLGKAGFSDCNPVPATKVLFLPEYRGVRNLVFLGFFFTHCSEILTPAHGVALDLQNLVDSYS